MRNTAFNAVGRVWLIGVNLPLTPLILSYLGQDRFVGGSDVSREMMQAAWKLGALLVAGDGSTLPFGRASFDLVICRGVLHHVPDRRAALAEIHRVLRPGGEFILIRAQQRLVGCTDNSRADVPLLRQVR